MLHLSATSEFHTKPVELYNHIIMYGLNSKSTLYIDKKKTHKQIDKRKICILKIVEKNALPYKYLKYNTNTSFKNFFKFNSNNLRKYFKYFLNTR